MEFTFTLTHGQAQVVREFNMNTDVLVEKPSTLSIISQRAICDALCDLVPFAQFKKREKHLWRSVAFRKVAG